MVPNQQLVIFWEICGNANFVLGPESEILREGTSNFYLNFPGDSDAASSFST